MDIVKMIGRKLLDVLRLRSLNVLRNSEYLKVTGWFNSFKHRQAIDCTGKAVPWLAYPVSSFLQQRLNKEMVVFEYGSGNSSLWLAERVKNLICCEHDSVWYGRMTSLAPANVSIIYRDTESGDYCREISKYDHEFDIIIIDGEDRVNCIKSSLEALKEDGVIILDDSFRDEYQVGKDFLALNGFKSIEITGPTPIYFNFGATTIFYRDTNCFNI